MTFIITEFIHFFFSTSKFFLYPQLGFSMDGSKNKTQDPKLSKRLPSFKDISLQGEEVEMVMGNLGICNMKGEYFPESLSCNDVLNMFEEEEPRLDEVKGAFDVFDENKDGFIEARELQRVLSAVGLKDRADIDECMKMIRVFDENDDGRIDFDEFVKFMEGTFC